VNKFEQTFFSQYVAQEDELKGVYHRHVFVVLFDILVWMFVGALLPAWLYSLMFLGDKQVLWFDVPFWLLSTYLFIIWAVLMYKLFDWYNDVWIVTKRGVVDLVWSPLVKNTTFTEYSDITGIEANESNWFDSFFKMGDLIVHKIGADLRISRIARPGKAVAKIQEMKNAMSSPESGQQGGNDMHIYFDGVKQQVKVGKNGGLYTE